MVGARMQGKVGKGRCIGLWRSIPYLLLILLASRRIYYLSSLRLSKKTEKTFTFINAYITLREKLKQ